MLCDGEVILQVQGTCGSIRTSGLLLAALEASASLTLPPHTERWWYFLNARIANRMQTIESPIETVTESTCVPFANPEVHEPVTWPPIERPGHL